MEAFDEAQAMKQKNLKATIDPNAKTHWVGISLAEPLKRLPVLQDLQLPELVSELPSSGRVRFRDSSVLSLNSFVANAPRVT